QYRRYLGTTPPTPDLDDARGGARPGAREKPANAKTIPKPLLQVRTLGGFDVQRGGIPIRGDGWRSRKAGSLFKVLLAAPGFALPREQAEELLWPQAEAEPARRNLNNALYSLRKLLGADAAPL